MNSIKINTLHNILSICYEKPLNMSNIAHPLKMTYSNVLLVIRFLIDFGLLTETRKGRQILIKITNKGKEVYQDINKLFQAHIELKEMLIK